MAWDPEDGAHRERTFRLQRWRKRRQRGTGAQCLHVNPSPPRRCHPPRVSLCLWTSLMTCDAMKTSGVWGCSVSTGQAAGGGGT